MVNGEHTQRGNDMDDGIGQRVMDMVRRGELAEAHRALGRAVAEKELRSMALAVLACGFVLLGQYTRGHEDGRAGMLEGGYFVRLWGTTKGLGQLAEGGGSPTLDRFSHRMDWPSDAEIMIMYEVTERE